MKAGRDEHQGCYAQQAAMVGFKEFDNYKGKYLVWGGVLPKATFMAMKDNLFLRLADVEEPTEDSDCS